MRQIMTGQVKVEETSLMKLKKDFLDHFTKGNEAKKQKAKSGSQPLTSLHVRPSSSSSSSGQNEKLIFPAETFTQFEQNKISFLFLF